MRIQCDTLKATTLLKKKGIKSSDADGFMSTLTGIDIFNLHSKHEVDSMLSQSVRDVFDKNDRKIASMLAKLDKNRAEQRREQDKKLADQRRERDLKLAEQRREFDARMKDISNYHESQLREQRNEAKEHRNELIAARRWTVGTIITVGLSLAAYLSALIHYNH